MQMTRIIVITVSGVVLLVCTVPLLQSSRLPTRERPSTPHNLNSVDRKLNELKSDINLMCGFSQGIPRIELGPSSEFVMEFRESWNTRFESKVGVARLRFVNTKMCPQYVIRLPDGRIFDAGRGVMSEAEILLLYNEGLKRIGNGRAILEVIEPFHEDSVLNWRAEPPFTDCKEFTRQKARLLIDRHLDTLPRSNAGDGEFDRKTAQKSMGFASWTAHG